MAIEFLKIPPYYFDHAHASLDDIRALLLQTLDPETKEPLSLTRPHIIYTSPLRRAVSAVASLHTIVPELGECIFVLPIGGDTHEHDMSTSVRMAFFAHISAPAQKMYRENLVHTVHDLLAKHHEKEITATVLSHTFTLTCIKEILRDAHAFLYTPEMVFHNYEPRCKLFTYGSSFQNFP